MASSNKVYLPPHFKISSICIIFMHKDAFIFFFFFFFLLINPICSIQICINVSHYHFYLIDCRSKSSLKNLHMMILLQRQKMLFFIARVKVAPLFIFSPSILIKNESWVNEMDDMTTILNL